MTYARQLFAVLFVGVAALPACGDDTRTTFFVPPAAPFRLSSDCETDQHCMSRAQTLAATLATPASAHERHLLGAGCVEAKRCGGAAGGCVCTMQVDDGGIERIALGGRQCALYGRSLACLWAEQDLPACTPGSCDCVQACGRALALLGADDQQVADVQQRRASCVDHACEYVTSIDGRCYAGALPTVGSLPVDCEQSDDALLGHPDGAPPGALTDSRLTEVCGVDEPKALPQVPDLEITVCERGKDAGELSP